MRRIFHRIPIKICLLVLGGEIVVLAALGYLYVGRIHHEVDLAIARKFFLVASLYERGMITAKDPTDRLYLSTLIQEDIESIRVVDTLTGEQIFIDDHYRTFRIDAGEVWLSEPVNNGDYQMAGLVPVERSAQTKELLYLRIKAGRHVAARHADIRNYSLGALGIVLFSVVLASLIVYRLFLPRIKQINHVLKYAKEGDFSVRVPTRDTDDELEQCILQVNSLIATIESYIASLNGLNRAGEELANAFTHEEVLRVVIETVEKELHTSCVGVHERTDFESTFKFAEKYGSALDTDSLAAVLAGVVKLGAEPVGTDQPHAGDGSTKPLIFLPVADEGRVMNVIVFRGQGQDLAMDPVTLEFLRTLLRLVSSSLNRIKSLREITQAESKYRALFMTAVGGIFRVNIGGSFEDINPALAAMLGYESVDELHDLAVVPADLYVDHEDSAEMLSSLRKYGRVKDIELRLRRKDGTIFPASLSGHAVKDRSGRVIAYEGYIADISERTRREQAERERTAAEAAGRVKSEMLADLERKNRQLEEALEEVRLMQKQVLQSGRMAAIGVLAGGIAHDLNNVLAGTVSYPDLLLMQLPQDHSMREPLGIIKEAGTKAVDMVNDLLTLSQGTNRASETRELNELVGACLRSQELMQLQSLNPALRVETVMCREATFIRCTSINIQKAIIGLLKSSIKATGGAGWLEISTYLQEIGRTDIDPLSLQAGTHAVLAVTDNGPVVPEEHHERLFEPFYVSNSAGDSVRRGGLELALAWNVIQEHEGTITVRSTDEGETTFEVYLPLVDEAAETADAEEPDGGELRGSGTILVVDDEPLQRDITGRMLLELGYQAYLVASGDVALEFIEKRSVDLVLLDMLMPPGINGYETYKEMLKIRPEQKVLIVSGYSQSSEVRETLALGAGGLLKKPFSLAQLGRAIMSV